MKNLLITLIILSVGHSFYTQNSVKTLPKVDVKTLEGKVVSSSEFENGGKPIIISFWATWCAPCKKELNNINEMYDAWQEETGVKLIAISIDDARFLSRVKPYVNTIEWEFEVYSDANQDLKRAMNVNNVPHTFLLNGKGEIVYEHNNYAERDENILYQKLKELTQ